MTRLLRVEARRIASRRVVRAFLVLAVLGILAGTVTVFVRSHKLTQAGQRVALEQAEARRQSDVRACANGDFGIPAGVIPPGMTLQQFCDQKAIPPVQEYVRDPRYHLTNARDALQGTNILFMLLLGVIGASMIGAEWQAGTMTTLLTWEPRRVRVFVAKAITVTLFAVIASLLLQALLGLLLYGVAVFRGTTAGADAAWLRSTVGVVLRGGVLAGLSALAAMAVATIARNTAFAIGAAFAWLAVVEPIIHGLRPGWSSWLVSRNAGIFLLGQTDFGRTATVAGILITVYVGAMALAAMASFRARDVA